MTTKPLIPTADPVDSINQDPNGGFWDDWDQILASGEEIEHIDIPLDSILEEFCGKL